MSTNQVNPRRLKNVDAWIGIDTCLPVVEILDNGTGANKLDPASSKGYRTLRRTHCLVGALRDAGVKGAVSAYRTIDSTRHNAGIQVTTAGGEFFILASTNTWGHVSGILGPEASLAVGVGDRHVRHATRRIALDCDNEQFREDLLKAMTTALAPEVWGETVSRPGHHSELRRAELDGGMLVVDLVVPRVGHLVVHIDPQEGWVGRIIQILAYDRYMPGEGAFGTFLRDELRKALGVTVSESEVTRPFVRLLAARVQALAAIA